MAKAMPTSFATRRPERRGFSDAFLSASCSRAVRGQEADRAAETLGLAPGQAPGDKLLGDPELRGKALQVTAERLELEKKVG
jgi:hypothetical protein